jgi:hypothetical protein
MLEQYLGCKSTITRNLLARDFEDQMIQDAMGIILFPSLRESRRSTLLVHAHLHSWELHELPNPLATRDTVLMNQLDNLHSFLMVFVEDYITKATAAFPPREYICLPQLSHNQSHLIFKGQKITKRFDSGHLLEGERRRFLRAFLRVELLSLVQSALSFSDRNHDLFRKLAIKVARQDREAIHCVWLYTSSLYGAIFAHCADAWLPAAEAPPETGLLFPDTVFADPIEYGKDIGMTGQEEQSAIENMARYGFSWIFTVIRFAIARPQDPKALEILVKKVCRSMDRTLNIEHFFKRRLPWEAIFDTVYRNKPDGRQGLAEPGWWKFLGSKLPNRHGGIQNKIFQQRAWAFFEDDRYYPKDTTAVSSFPSRKDLTGMEQDKIDKILSLVGPGPVSTVQLERIRREFRRSQKWQDKMKQRQANVSGTESSSSMISIGNNKVSLPAIEDREQLLKWSSGGVVQWDVSERK